MESIKEYLAAGLFLAVAVGGNLVAPSTDIQEKRGVVVSQTENLENKVGECKSLVQNLKFERFNFYTEEICDVVEHYNQSLNPPIPLDPLTILGMLKTETGSSAHITQFLNDPLQTKRDFGDNVVRNRKDHIPYIASRVGEERFSNPSDIEVGIAFLYNKAIKIERHLVEEGSVYKYTVRPGDNAWNIADKKGSTFETLEKFNEGIDLAKLMPGDKLQVRSSHYESEVKWKSWDEAVESYNGGGNPRYLADVELAKKEITSRF